jgi:hypothetical protein
MSLQDALRHNDINRIVELINFGANINETLPSNNWNALMIAFVNDTSFDIIKWLIEKGANVNSRTTQGSTALMYAARNAEVDGVEKIQLLLENGADINARDNKGYTPLLIAIKFVDSTSSLKVVKYLVEHGANLFDKLNTGETVSTFADASSNPEVKDYIYSQIWKQLYSRDMDLAMKYSRSGIVKIPKDIWEIILLNKRQQSLCANLENGKNSAILYLFAVELGIPVTKETTKGQLCALISRQLSYGKFYNENLVNEMNKYKSQILELARKFNIDTSQPIGNVIQQMSKLF